MRILAIGAHPDDLEIYCWGSLCAWAAMGAGLVLAVATDGAAGGAPGATGAGLAARRAAEARDAAAPLGAEPRFLGFPDGELLSDRSLTGALRGLIAETRPDLLVTHAPEDYHADHRALAQAALHAAGFAVPVLHLDCMGGTGFTPTHWVEITAHVEAKARAIRAHASQRPERFVALADRLAAHRAGEAGGPPEARAEAFRFNPRHPFADIRALLPPPPPLRPVSASPLGQYDAQAPE